MRKLSEINDEIQALLGTNRSSLKKAQVSRIKSRLEFLNLMKDYLTAGPTEEFISKEVKRIEDRINSLMSLFDEKAYKEPKTARLKFEKDNGIPHLRSQLKALWYILN